VIYILWVYRIISQIKLQRRRLIVQTAHLRLETWRGKKSEARESQYIALICDPEMRHSINPVTFTLTYRDKRKRQENCVIRREARAPH
jgi:hypothetical protein